MEINIQIVGHSVQRTDYHIQLYRAQKRACVRVCMRLTHLNAREHLNTLGLLGRARVAQAGGKIPVFRRAARAVEVEVVGQADDVQPGRTAGTHLILNRLRIGGVRRIPGMHMQIDPHRWFPPF